MPGFTLGMALPVAAMVACALVLAAGATWWTAREQNRFAARTQARLAAGVLGAARESTERTVVDYAVWDEAAQHVALERDGDWAYDNLLGDWLEGIYGLEMAFLLDGEGRAFHGLLEGERTDRQPDELLSGGFDLIVRAARDGPGAATGLVRAAAGVPAMVVAHRIEPNTDKMALPAGAEAFLVMVDLLDVRRLGELGSLFLLSDLRFVPGRGPPSSVPLTGADGNTLGSLAYAPERPGDVLLRSVAPPLAALAFGLLLVTLLVLRQARHAALALRESEARAHLDGLTGLPNRALLRARLARELAHLEPGGPGLGLLYLDLDGFKLINDTFGHAAGDELLMQVARRLAGCGRAARDTVARLGGDEFVVLLPDTASSEVAVACAERVMSVLHEPLQLEAAPGGVTVGVSVGVAHAVAGLPVDTDELLRAADHALYRAKRDGRGVWRLAEGLPEAPPGLEAPLVLPAVVVAPTGAGGLPLQVQATAP